MNKIRTWIHDADLYMQILRFPIPQEIILVLNEEYGLDLKPGATYREAIQNGGQVLSHRSKEWADLYRFYRKWVKPFER